MERGNSAQPGGTMIEEGRPGDTTQAAQPAGGPQDVAEGPDTREESSVREWTEPDGTSARETKLPNGETVTEFRFPDGAYRGITDHADGSSTVSTYTVGGEGHTQTIDADGEVTFQSDDFIPPPPA